MLWLPAFGSAKAVQPDMHAPDNLFPLKQSPSVTPASHYQFALMQGLFEPPVIVSAYWVGREPENAGISAS